MGILGWMVRDCARMTTNSWTEYASEGVDSSGSWFKSIPSEQSTYQSGPIAIIRIVWDCDSQPTPASKAAILRITCSTSKCEMLLIVYHFCAHGKLNGVSTLQRNEAKRTIRTRIKHSPTGLRSQLPVVRGQPCYQLGHGEALNELVFCPSADLKHMAQRLETPRNSQG